MEVKAAGAWVGNLAIFMCRLSSSSGNLNFLDA
jgi:hypothetical protein